GNSEIGDRARPILHDKMRGEGFGPVDFRRVDRLQLAEIDDHPLRVQGIRLISVVLIEIRITFPVGCSVAIGDPRITLVARLVDRVSPAGQIVTMRDEDVLVGTVTRGPIALLMRLVAPSAVFAPMPSFDTEFCPQAIGDLTKAGSLHLLDVSFSVD